MSNDMPENLYTGDHLEAHIFPSSIMSYVSLNGVRLKNVTNIRTDSDRTHTRITMDFFPDFKGPSMVVEGYLVTKDIAELYGNPEEIARNRTLAELWAKEHKVTVP